MITESKLEEEKKNLLKEISDLELDIDSIAKQLNDKKSLLGNKERRLKQIESAQNIEITSHAFLRYLERVLDIDIKSIRNEIINEELKNQVSVLGDGKYPINNKLYAVVSDYKIVTTYPTNNKS